MNSKLLSRPSRRIFTGDYVLAAVFFALVRSRSITAPRVIFSYIIIVYKKDKVAQTEELVPLEQQNVCFSPSRPGNDRRHRTRASLRPFGGS